MDNKSIYTDICEHIVDGELKDFQLRQNQSEKEFSWADGALDGVMLYHMGHAEVTDKDKEELKKALEIASKGEDRFEEADSVLVNAVGQKGAICFLDDIQGALIEKQAELNIKNIIMYVLHLMTETDKIPLVKLGLALLELFEANKDEIFTEIVKNLALCNEFTFSALFVMQNWDNGNDEIFEIAKKVKSWGRIHAIEKLEPTTDEIKQWLLREGVNNEVVPAYSALTCWNKSDAEKVLFSDNISDEDYKGLCALIEALVDEGPVAGISDLENGAKIIDRFLDVVTSRNTSLSDYEIVDCIMSMYDSDNDDAEHICEKCKSIIHSDNCIQIVKDSIPTGKGISLAKELGIDYKPTILKLMTENFAENNWLLQFADDDPEFIEKAAEIWRKCLPLETMKGAPTDIMGPMIKGDPHPELEFLLSRLDKYPLVGTDLVEVALQSPPERARKHGINVVKEWVVARQTPLGELCPELQELLKKVLEIEVVDDLKPDMEALINGKICFDEENAE